MNGDWIFIYLPNRNCTIKYGEKILSSYITIHTCSNYGNIRTDLLLKSNFIQPALSVDHNYEHESFAWGMKTRAHTCVYEPWVGRTGFCFYATNRPPYGFAVCTFGIET